MQKRPDLQGIRGFAILSVVLYHFYPDIFKNGYVGVDQFFMLSGFLMGRILSKEDCLTTGVVSSFYYRRFKRLLPLYALFIFSTICFTLTMFPLSTFEFNLPHLIRAMLFVSNTKQEDDSLTYERMVLSAEILYTHTWSLSVEVQFYLIAPFLLLTPKFLPQKIITVPMCLASYICFSYYLNFEESKYFAFNSMFTRIWQFLLGVICFRSCASLGSSQTDPNDEDHMPLFEYKNKTADDLPRICHWLSNLLILSMVILCFYPLAISTHLVRALTCCQTFGFIYSGELVPNRFLSTRFAVYLGDISYSLYLLHWPICAYFKQNHLDTPVGSFIGILCSFTLAVLFTETYEKFYLKQEKPAIIALCVVLYAANLTLISLFAPQFAIYTEYGGSVVVSGVTSNAISSIQSIANETDTFHWRPRPNMTKEQVIALNVEFSKTDTAKLTLKECTYTQFGRSDGNRDYCQIQNPNFTGNKTVLMVGNSYAQNIARMQIHVEECEQKTKKMALLAKPGCEVLEDSVVIPNIPYCSNWNQYYLQGIIDAKPDVLFITTRHLVPMMPNKTNPDEILEGERKRLKEIEKYVKDKVFIFDALPRPTQNQYTTPINNGIRSGNLVSQDSLWDKSADYQLARRRMSILSKECSKCELLDVMPVLVNNGTFEFYNQSNGIQYFVDGIHFSDYGLDKIRPIFRKLCRNL